MCFSWNQKLFILFFSVARIMVTNYATAWCFLNLPKHPTRPETPSSVSWSASLYLQRAFFAGVKLYDKGNYEESVTLFEEALTEYYLADVECRALCEGPLHFEEQDHVLYKYNLYELISGTDAFVLKAFLLPLNVVKLSSAVLRRIWEFSVFKWFFGTFHCGYCVFRAICVSRNGDLPVLWPLYKSFLSRQFFLQYNLLLLCLTGSSW